MMRPDSEWCLTLKHSRKSTTETFEFVNSETIFSRVFSLISRNATKIRSKILKNLTHCHVLSEYSRLQSTRLVKKTQQQ